jgi:hypothetical protein
MKLASLAILSLLAAFSLAGCTAMQQGLENLNTMAAEQAAVAQQEQQAAWKSDIENNHYSGTVRVAFIPVVPANKAETGINQERAIALLKESFASHQQFELLDEQKTESLLRDLHPFAGSLNASRVNSGAKRRENFGGVDADVILRSGLRAEQFTGINKKTGKLGQGVKLICWTEYMVIDGNEVTKGSFEESNIFKSEDLMKQSAQSFHETVLNNLMIQHLAARVAETDALAR